VVLPAGIVSQNLVLVVLQMTVRMTLAGGVARRENRRFPTRWFVDERGRESGHDEIAYDEEVHLIAAEPQLRSVNSALAGGSIVAAGSAATSYLTGFGCPSLTLAGCWCAFCGATRSVVALVRGQPDAAIRNNALVVLVLGFIVLRSLLSRTEAKGLAASADAWIVRVDLRAWAALLFGWTVLRNLSWLWFLAPVA
jgi:hypothetical protein